MNKILLILLVLVSFPLLSQNFSFDNSYWEPDGEINAIVHDSTSNSVIIGGNFHYIGPKSNYAAILENQLNKNCSEPNDVVNVSISDGNGGWYIGGKFTMIGDSIRERIAHIDSSGNLASNLGKIGLNNEVMSLHLVDSILYIGGEFTFFSDNNVKKYSAQFTSHDYNNVNPYFPQTNGEVNYSISDENGGFFIAGIFSLVGDSIRNNIAHIDSNGLISSWAPNLSNIVKVNTMIKKGNDIIVSCLNFSTSGQFYSTILKINTLTGLINNSPLTINGSVNSTCVIGDSLFIGGQFDSISNNYRLNFGAVKISDYSILPTSINFNDRVNTITYKNDKLYLGGNFTQVNGQVRKRIASVDVNSLTLNNLLIESNNEIECIYVKDSIMHFGGSFDSINNQYRKNFGSYNLISNNLTNNILNFNLPISTINSFDSLLIIGGSFSMVNSINSNNIVIINNNTGEIIPSEINPLNTVKTISVSFNKIFIGGNFDNAGIKIRKRLCSINLNTLQITKWKPNANSSVKAITKLNGNICVAGNFTSINGVSRNYFGIVDETIGILNPFNPSPNNIVSCLELVDTNLYIGGNFTVFNGQPRGGGAAISKNLQTLSWNPNTNNIIKTMKFHGNSMFVAGNFTSLNGQPNTFIAKVNLTNGLPENWVAQNNNIILSLPSNYPVNEVNAIEIIQNKLILGGWFYNYLNSGKNFLVSVDINSGVLDSIFPNSDSRIFSISKSNNRLFFGGAFKSLGGITACDLLQIDLNTKRPTSWRPTFDWKVVSLKLKDSILYVGGGFSYINGVSRTNLASFNLHTKSLTNWNPILPSSNEIKNIEVSNDKIFVSGFIQNIDGFPRSNLASFHSNTGVLTNWNPVINSFTSGMKINNDKLYLIGAFTNVNGLNRPFACSFDINTDLLLPFKVDSSLFSINCTAIDFKNNDAILLGFSSPIANRHIVKVNALTGESVEIFNQNQFFGLTILKSLQNSFFSSIVDPSNVNAFQLRQFNYFSQDPAPNIPIWNIHQSSKIEVVNNKLFIVGDFQNLNNLGKKYFAVCDYKDFIINPNFDTVNTCNSYIWPQNNQTYTETGTYSTYFTSSQGNDSIIVLNLTINQTTHSYDTIISCNPITWIDGNIYSLSNDTTTFILPNSVGCDSIIHLNFTLLEPTNDTFNISECDSFYWSSTNQFYYISGYYTDSIISTYGCDSIVTLNLTILQSTSGVDSQTICDSLTWIDGNTYYSNNTSAQHMLSNAVGCDSIITLNLTILQPTSGIDTHSVCDSLTWIDGNTYYSNNTTATHVLTNALGCDSIITLDLTILPTQISQTTIFSLPSSEASCTGQLAITTIGNPNFEISINGSTTFTSSGYSLQTNLCPGIYDVSVIDYCGDTVFNTAVISTDSNFVFNNPFIDSIAVDSLGATITNCDIYYNSIDTAFIDSLWATGNQVNVIWNIIDSSGSNLDTITYNLINGNGVYWLQLSIFCPFKSIDENFTVTQAIYFENGTAHIVGLNEHNESLNSFLLYPNPTTNSVTITYKSTVAAKVLLFDAQGKFIQERMIYSGGGIDLVELERGVYFVSLELDGKTQVKRIIKQ